MHALATVRRRVLAALAAHEQHCPRSVEELRIGREGLRACASERRVDEEGTAPTGHPMSRALLADANLRHAVEYGDEPSRLELRHDLERKAHCQRSTER